MPCLTIRRCQCRAALVVRTTPVFLLETPISLKEAPPPPALGPGRGAFWGLALPLSLFLDPQTSLYLCPPHPKLPLPQGAYPLTPQKGGLCVPWREAFY